MGLADIAAGIEVTAEQETRGVPTVDDTGVALRERFDAHAEALPCEADAAATVFDAYAGGASVGESAREAGVAPMTAAKALHRCGVTGVTPLGPTAREILRDWLDGELPRTEARTLTGVSKTEFALAAYVETHEPIEELTDATAGELTPGTNATVAKRDALAETMSDPSEFF
ncbi:hypothetical protein [Haloprofundus salinisoli]|uniref:DUF7858 family protein n=1 Tax=Haloprofundus salinisoli TaxID=2876193 RepID=UPI001CCF59A7|nr:hypothetical protein [Haloprofundus salinisoli]